MKIKRRPEGHRYCSQIYRGKGTGYPLEDSVVFADRFFALLLQD